jgi:hypothetical protein
MVQNMVESVRFSDSDSLNLTLGTLSLLTEKIIITDRKKIKNVWKHAWNIFEQNGEKSKNQLGNICFAYH